MQPKIIAGIFCLAFLLWGCQTSTNQLRVLGDQVQTAQAEQQVDTSQYVVNGGPGSTEVVYQDGYGISKSATSNVVKVPILEKCDSEPVVYEDPLPTPVPEICIEPEPDVVRYQVTMHSYPSQILASHIEPPPVEQKEVVIPKKPPEIELKKMSDEDKLCCDKQLTFRIRFTNMGEEPAYNVEITDILPANVSYVEETAGCDSYESDVNILRNTDESVQKITWKIPGPIEPDSMGEVFYTVECYQQRPKLSCSVQFHPKHLLPGEEGKVICRVINSGAGSAKNVQLRVLIPEGLEYKSEMFGTKEDFFFEEIPPNQSVERSFVVRMRRNGNLDEVTAQVSASNSPACDCDVTSIPVLVIEKEGPRSVANRVPIEYTLAVQNNSKKDVSATGCILVDKLPPMGIFKSASDNGTYNGKDHTVTWSLGTISPNQIVTRTVTIIPQEPCTLVDNAHVTCAEGVTIYDTCRTVVRGVSALAVSSYDTEDPVEVGGITIYIIDVTNEGFKNVTDLELMDEIPAGSSLVSAVATDEAGNIIPHTMEEGKVIFEKYPSLAGGKKLIYKITVKAESKTQLLNTASIRYNEFSKVIVVEEPTETY